MTRLADPAVTAWVSRPAVPPPTVPRGAELWTAGLGVLLATVFLGGFSLTMNRVDEETFERVVQPALGGDQAGAASYESMQTLGAWFGFTLVAVLVLGAVGLLVARRRPWLRRAGWWFAAAGLVCLLGSQLILFPVAFFFFLSAGFFALRPVPDRSTS
ncbi:MULTISPECIES: DUF4064 domain-containing protein [unclassified Actinotalea]|uniref:DUF4064 domain-containing protein n=1 Tax=unclassified Actinotalea TaxID=2638618 RepID=UPI0015F43395|nr:MULTISPECIES: DUF4064 domain-containing protein [unclassified Actinotalea]